MIRRGSLHSRQYFATVSTSFMPFIWNAPSPTMAMATRSGNANFAAITYGTPGPIVARLPESDAIIPLRIFRYCAYQLAVEPESAARMQLSGSFGESSAKTRCGLIGFASCFARSATSFHQSRISSSICARHSRLVLRLSKGISACSDSLLSPVRLTSIG